MADSHSGFSAEEMEKAARAIAEKRFGLRWGTQDGYQRDNYRRLAGAVLSASGAVPRAEHEELWAENQRLASDARAESAEARCKSLEDAAHDVVRSAPRLRPCATTRAGSTRRWPGMRVWRLALGALIAAARASSSGSRGWRDGPR